MPKLVQGQTIFFTGTHFFPAGCLCICIMYLFLGARESAPFQGAKCSGGVVSNDSSLFSSIFSVTVQMPPAAEMDWTMKQERSRLLATDETDIGGGTERGTKMVRSSTFIQIRHLSVNVSHLCARVCTHAHTLRGICGVIGSEKDGAVL